MDQRCRMQIRRRGDPLPGAQYCSPPAFDLTRARSKHSSTGLYLRPPRKVHQFHVLGSYYRGYIEGFAWIAKPLTELMKKDAPFLWSLACQVAFNGLRSTIASAVMRHHFDPSLPTTVTTDTADGCLGAALHQALWEVENDTKLYFSFCCLHFYNVPLFPFMLAQLQDGETGTVVCLLWLAGCVGGECVLTSCT